MLTSPAWYQASAEPAGSAGFTFTLFHRASSTRPAGAPRGLETSDARQQCTSTSPRAARLRVPGRRRRRDLHHLARHLAAFRVAHDDVAARRAARDVEPQIARLGHVERQVVVVLRAAPDQHLEALDQKRAVGTSLAGHRRPFVARGTPLTSRKKSALIGPARTLHACVMEGGSMARVWQRLAGGFVVVVLVLVLSQCKGLKPIAGRSLRDERQVPVHATRRPRCSARTARYVSLPCRGPGAARGMGTSSTCDDDLALEGDACMQTQNDNYACGVDKRKEFALQGAASSRVRTCKGPKKCTVSGNMINCDDSMADVGDLVRGGRGRRQLRLQPRQEDRGRLRRDHEQVPGLAGLPRPKRLQHRERRVHCDHSVGARGREVPPARQPLVQRGRHAGAQVLPAVHVESKQRDCKHGAAKSRRRGLDCE